MKKSDDKSEKRENEFVSAKELMAKWLEHNRYRVKESTLANYRWVVNRRLMPLLNDLLMDELDRERLEKLFIELMDSGGIRKKALSIKSTKDAAAIFRAAMRFGEERGLCREIRFKLPVRNVQSEKKVLEYKEQFALEGYLLNGTDTQKLGLLLGLYTGVRIGEMCGLRWGDIDMKKNELHISRTVQRIASASEKGGAKTRLVFGEPKSQRSNRYVPIPVFLVDLLEKCRNGAADEAFVLTGRKDRCTEPRTYSYRIKNCLKKCGIKGYTFHSMRHTFATRCIESGCDARTLSELMGHSNVSTTLRVYVHSSMDSKKAAVERMRRAFKESA